MIVTLLYILLYSLNAQAVTINLPKDAHVVTTQDGNTTNMHVYMPNKVIDNTNTNENLNTIVQSQVQQIAPTRQEDQKESINQPKVVSIPAQQETDSGNRLWALMGFVLGTLFIRDMQEAIRTPVHVPSQPNNQGIK